jgi:hypothetical protein
MNLKAVFISIFVVFVVFLQHIVEAFTGIGCCGHSWAVYLLPALGLGFFVPKCNCKCHPGKIE